MASLLFILVYDEGECLPIPPAGLRSSQSVRTCCAHEYQASFIPKLKNRCEPRASRRSRGARHIGARPALRSALRPDCGYMYTTCSVLDRSRGGQDDAMRGDGRALRYTRRGAIPPFASIKFMYFMHSHDHGVATSDQGRRRYELLGPSAASKSCR